MGMVQTFSSYQKLQEKDPAEAERLSNDIKNKWDINLRFIHKSNQWLPALISHLRSPASDLLISTEIHLSISTSAEICL